MRIPFVLQPVWQAIAVLVAFVLLIFRNTGGFSGDELIHFLVIIGFGMSCFFILQFLTGKKKPYESSLITCLILYLLIDPTGRITGFDFTITSLLIVISVAISVKFFLEVGGRPVINPAVAGTLVGLLLSQFLPQAELVAGATRLEFEKLFSVGGIGISFTALLFAIWIFWGLPKWDRVFTLVAFFLVAGLLSYFQGGSSSVVKFFTDAPYLYFFASFLLIDPKTSPDGHLLQWVYGAVSALLVFLPEFVPLPSAGIAAFWKENTYLIGLLFANIGLFVFTAARLHAPVSSKSS